MASSRTARARSTARAGDPRRRHPQNGTPRPVPDPSARRRSAPTAQPREWNSVETIAALPERSTCCSKSWPPQKAAKQAARVAVERPRANGHAARPGTASLDIGDIVELEAKRVWFTKKLHALAENVRDEAEGSRHNTLLAHGPHAGRLPGQPDRREVRPARRGGRRRRLAGRRPQVPGWTSTRWTRRSRTASPTARPNRCPGPTSLDLPGVCTVEVEDEEEPVEDPEEEPVDDPGTVMTVMTAVATIQAAMVMTAVGTSPSPPRRPMPMRVQATASPRHRRRRRS